jgi:serine/threonine protein kinase
MKPPLPDDTLLLPPADARREAPHRTPCILAIGELLSDTYEICGLLGTGAMGQVFEAHDRALDRRVAIKVMLPGAGLTSLRREAQVLAAIRHPGTVTVHALGAHRGIDYMVMERLYAVSLLEHLTQRRNAGALFTVGEALDILLGLAEGMVAVHRAGVAHRDIKPANIMLAPGNRVVLVDFGIFLSGDGADGRIAGSPAYMAPEAIAGAVAPGAGHLVDLYAVGVVAFELLTGRVPFDGGDVATVFEGHLRQPAPSMAEHRKDVPPALSTLIGEMLAKSPRERPQSAESVLWQLRVIQTQSHAALRDEAFSVLIVDDDPDAIRLIELVVRAAVPGAEICVAQCGERALELVRERQPDLMLLDLEMPGTNGLEVCIYLRGTRLADRCTIVPVSGKAQDHDRQLLQQLGVTHFVPKGPSLRQRLAPVVQEVHRLVSRAIRVGRFS